MYMFKCSVYSTNYTTFNLIIKYVKSGFRRGMRSSFFWTVTQRRLTDSYRHIGQGIKSHAKFLLGLLEPLMMGPIGCPETSVTYHQSKLRNIPGKRTSQICCV